MLPPRVMQTVGLVLVAASALAFVVLGETVTLVLGLPLGVAILVGSVVGGGPEPSRPGGESWEEAMATLRRVTVATSLVSGALVVSAVVLWRMGGPPGILAGPVEVLLVVALALLLLYGGIVAAAAILLVSHVTGRDEV